VKHRKFFRNVIFELHNNRTLNLSFNTENAFMVCMYLSVTKILIAIACAYFIKKDKGCHSQYRSVGGMLISLS